MLEVLIKSQKVCETGDRMCCPKVAKLDCHPIVGAKSRYHSLIVHTIHHAFPFVGGLWPFRLYNLVIPGNNVACHRIPEKDYVISRRRREW